MLPIHPQDPATKEDQTEGEDEVISKRKRCDFTQEIAQTRPRSLNDQPVEFGVDRQDERVRRHRQETDDRICDLIQTHGFRIQEKADPQRLAFTENQYGSRAQVGADGELE